MKVPKINVAGTFVAGFSYSLLVIGVFGGKEWSEPHPSLKGWLTDISSGLDPWVLAGKKFSAKVGETLVMTPTKGPQRLLLVGAGEREKATAETIRRVGGHAGAYAREQKISSVTLLPFFGDLLFNKSALLRAYVEGAALAMYAYEHKRPEQPEEIEISVCFAARPYNDGEAAMQEAAALVRAKYQARDWGNTPANLLTPAVFAEEVLSLVSDLGLNGILYGPPWMEDNHMGALLAVARGSREEPRFCHFWYVPKDHDPAKGRLRKVVLIGKGVTFDAGGISLKPGAKMDEMKYDMCGGAAVLASMITVAEMQPNCEVHFVVPMTENLPDGNSVKPGDVVTSMSGKTIEILNTDAEGRLILCDALTYAEKFIDPSGPDDVVLTFATLTGAVIMALGHDKTALYSNNDELAEIILETEELTGEGLWRMPLISEMEDDFKSKFSDVANIGKQGEGGSIVGALFLQKFVPENWNWAYCDIAGTAWGTRASIPYNITGATGVMVGMITETIRGSFME